MTIIWDFLGIWNNRKNDFLLNVMGIQTTPFEFILCIYLYSFTLFTLFTMSSVIQEMLDSILPESVKQGKLYGDWIVEASALMEKQLYADLQNCEDEEDKNGAVKDFVYDFWTQLSVSEDEFQATFSDQLQNVEIEDVKVPTFKTSNTETPEKIVNPRTGNKIKFGGRLFKTLVKDGLLHGDGTYTENGQTIFEEYEAKKAPKIPHPTRKGGTIVLDGKKFNELINEGWVYDAEEKTWTEPEKEESEEASEEVDEDKTEEASEETDSEKSEEEDKTEEADSEKSEEEEPKSSRKAPRKNSKKSPKQSPRSSPEKPSEEEKEMVPHPTRKGRELVKGGRGFNAFLKKDWKYDDETKTWEKPE